jgi:glycosyltransferase involved in cell wall biosynthesis
MNISVIIPCYNAASWLPKTISIICLALDEAGIKKAEIIVIDDGSMDNSADVVRGIKENYPVKVISQKNQGRLMARKKGLSVAKYDFVLLIDTRVYINKSALKYVKENIFKHPDRLVWTSHVYIDKKGNLYARFWDAITFLAWRKYFKSPQFMQFGTKNFDLYPKGTTCLFIKKDIFASAVDWYINTHPDHSGDSNDDTSILRKIAEDNMINISPRYSSIYHSRDNMNHYIKHVYHRGKVFVDGFLNKETIYFFPIILFLIFSIPALILFIFALFQYTFVTIVAIVCLFALLIMTIRALGVIWADTFSFVTILPIFVFSYGIGIWKASFTKLTKVIR